INAYWIGRYDECLKSCRKILSTATLSDADRKRIQANADFVRQKLSGDSTDRLGEARTARHCLVRS
ncbi:MAG: hypothetical protein WCB44_21440, partial [Stellaceae bacterium]